MTALTHKRPKAQIGSGAVAGIKRRLVDTHDRLIGKRNRATASGPNAPVIHVVWERVII